MTNAPLKTYGFNYEYEEKEYAFHVLATSAEEAKNRVSAMCKAVLFGELTESITKSDVVYES